jgi:hypothetical protein
MLSGKQVPGRGPIGRAGGLFSNSRPATGRLFVLS